MFRSDWVFAVIFSEGLKAKQHDGLSAQVLGPNWFRVNFGYMNS